MTTWHKRARLGVAIFGLAVAGIVYAAMGERRVSAPRAPVSRIDEKAIAETLGATFERTIPLGVDRQVTIDADLQQQYPDGSMRFTGVNSIRVRRGEKDFVITAREALAGAGLKNLEVNGDVKLEVSDGFQLATDRVTYSEDEGLVRAAGAVTFSRGRMSGSGIGISYDEKTEVVTIAEQTHIVTRDEGGNTVTELTSSFATLDRMQDLLLLNEGVHVLRGSQVIDARDAVAQLSPEEDVIRFLKLIGDARVTGAGASIDAMSARDIDLDYTDDGVSLEKVLMRGGGAIAMTGQNGATGRQIHGDTLDLTLAPDGSLTRAIGKGAVQLDLPAAGNAPLRNIRAATLDARGQTGRGLTDAIFTGDVSFTEEGARTTRRTGHAQSLQIALANDAVTSATFTGRASFDEQGLIAAAPKVEYQPAKGVLVLSNAEGSPIPCVADSQVNVDAQRIEITLDGHLFTANGKVKTQLRGQSTAKPTTMCGGRPVAAAAGRGQQAGSRLPGLMDPKAVANVTADMLDYRGAGAAIQYTGTPAIITQGATAVRGNTIRIDQANGDFTATGAASLTLVLDAVDSVGRAQEIRYSDAKRVVSLDGMPGAARGAPAPPTAFAALTGSAQGDLKARRIEILLAKGENKVERIDATRDVTVALETRKVTGATLSYDAADGRYDVEGNSVTPVALIEREGKDCRESSGTTLRFFRTGTRVELDGQAQRRFETKPSSACPATFR